MTCRDAILLSHGREVTGLYRGDPVRLMSGHEGLVVGSVPDGETTVMLSPREFRCVPTRSLALA